MIVYELLDEMMDFGFPQTTESKILQEYVPFLSRFPSSRGFVQLKLTRGVSR